jgi:hypothetical protein
MNFRAFADDSTTIQVGDLTLENQGDRLSVYGSLDITRDRDGLAKARELKYILEGVVAALAEESALPDKLSPADVAMVDNPFAKSG